MVAEAAGVHNTTVSLALRNNPSLPAKTRERIQAIAAALGYRPDPALRALASYRRGISGPRQVETLAFVTATDTRHGWRDDALLRTYFEGASARAEELGFRLEPFWLREPGLTPLRLSRILDHRGIHAVLLATHPDTCLPTATFDWSRLCGVALGFVPNDSTLQAVIPASPAHPGAARCLSPADGYHVGVVAMEILAGRLEQHGRELPKVKITTVVEGPLAELGRTA
jgi:LacI family transcriptional regulator